MLCLMAMSESKDNMHIPCNESRQWLDAMRLNDSDHVLETLCTAEEDEKRRLVNGQFNIKDVDVIQQVFHIYPDTIHCTYPITVAILYGSFDVVTILLEHGADPLVCEERGENILHMLVLVNATCPTQENNIVQVYINFAKILPLHIQKSLLHGDNYFGLRPLEYAANKGCIKLLRAMLETKDVYKIHESYGGSYKYIFYDVTEYEVGDRMDKSPLYYLTLSTDSTSMTTEFADFMEWKPIKQWCKSKTKANAPIMFFWFLIRLLYSINHMVLASNRLSYSGGKHESSISDNYTNYTQYICSDAQPIELGQTTRTMLLSYGIMHSVFVLIYDVVDLLHLVSKKRYVFPQGRYSERSILQTNMTFRNNQFVTAFAIIILYSTYLAGYNSRGSILTSALELVTTFGIYTSMLFYALVLPYIGFHLVIIQRLMNTLWYFAILFTLFLAPFATFFMLYMNINTNQGCIHDFRSFTYSMYASLRMMLNLVEPADYDVINEGFLMFTHVVFVFIIGILLINFLIASMTIIAGKLMDHEHVMMDMYALYIAFKQELRLQNVLHSYFRIQKNKRLLCKDSLCYIVDIQRLEGHIDLQQML